MRRSYTHHDFEVPGVKAIVSVEGEEIEGYLEAKGQYEQEWLQTESFNGSTRKPNRRDIAAIDGLFGTDPGVVLGNALSSCILRFPLLDGTASVRIRAESTGEAGIWHISSI